jgi:transposase
MPNADLFEIELFELPQETGRLRSGAIPARVEPLPGESLSSWLLRYAAPFAVSPETLLLDHEDASLLAGPDWWRRPDPLVIARLTERTGLPASALVEMSMLQETFEEPIPDRFSSVRFQFPRPAKQASHRVGICPQCVSEDTFPYARKTWTQGWVGMCPDHAMVLIHECPECRYKLRMPRLNSDELFAPDRCKRCGCRFSDSPRQAAHPLAIDLQQLLLAHRAHGGVPLQTLGVIEWPVVWALFDVLLGMVWSGPKRHFREQLFVRIRRDLGLTGELDSGHYAGWLILTWLLDQWPTHLRVAIATLKIPRPRQQLERWQALDSLVRKELERVFIPGWPDESHDEDRGWWRGWIDSLPLSGEALRELATADRFPCRRARLLALADVRDGMPVEVAAQTAGITARTLYRWIRRGAEGGLEAALDRPSGRLNHLQKLEIANWIASASPDERRWRRDRVQNEVKRRFRVALPEYTAERLLFAYGPWKRRIGTSGRRMSLPTLPVSAA